MGIQDGERRTSDAAGGISYIVRCVKLFITQSILRFDFNKRSMNSLKIYRVRDNNY